MLKCEKGEEMKKKVLNMCVCVYGDFFFYLYERIELPIFLF